MTIIIATRREGVIRMTSMLDKSGENITRSLTLWKYHRINGGQADR